MAGRKKVWYLRRLDLFSSLTDDEINDVAQVLGEHHVPANREILGDRKRDRMYLIKAGAVRLHSSDDQHQVTLALLGPGKVFGLSSDLGDDDARMYATTLAPSYICEASWSTMMQVFARYPLVMVKMTSALAERLFRAESWRARLGMSSPCHRLAYLLVELSDEFGEQIAPGQRIRFRLTQTDLGRMIGLSRETVSRVMAEFDRLGWVARDEGLIVVRNRDVLAVCKDTDAA